LKANKRIQKLFPDALQLFEGDICGMIKHRAEARAARSNLAAARQQADNPAALREQSFNINVTTWTAKCCTPGVSILQQAPRASRRVFLSIKRMKVMTKPICISMDTLWIGTFPWATTVAFLKHACAKDHASTCT
jgi:hypothetical protein